MNFLHIATFGFAAALVIACVDAANSSSVRLPVSSVSEFESEVLAMNAREWPTVQSRCASQLEAEGVGILEAALMFNKEGRVIDVRMRPSTGNTECVREGIMGHLYVPPPSAPYRMKVTMRVL